jgi:hypothetical protein
MTTQPSPPLGLPAMAGHAIAREVRQFGQRRVETGGFLLAPRGQGAVTVMAFAGEVGIIRERLLFQVSALALDQLFGFADQRSCWIPAQFHSHAAGAFLSRTDQQLGLRVKGFTSTVIPDFANPPCEVTAWGWWRFSSEDWIPCQPPQIEGDDLEVVTFDEEGVHAQ